MNVDLLDVHPLLLRNNVHIVGHGDKVMVMAHGFGCDQTMWRFLIPALEQDYRLVLFDYTGCGQSDVSYFIRDRYSHLEGYAQDVIDICDALELSDAVFMGHSVSSIIGMLATIQRPDLFAELIMVCPSPCFLNFPPEYLGGFERGDLEELINLMDKNHVGWANYLAPLVMGGHHPPEMTAILSNSFCSTDPTYLKPFAKATFFSDHRQDLPRCKRPCLILQSSHDALAAKAVGEFMQNQLPQATMNMIEASGHCLHMTHPEQVAEAFKSFTQSMAD